MGLNKGDGMTSRMVIQLVLKWFSGYWVGKTTQRGKRSWSLRSGLLSQNVESTESTLLNLNHEITPLKTRLYRNFLFGRSSEIRGRFHRAGRWTLLNFPEGTLFNRVNADYFRIPELGSNDRSPIFERPFEPRPPVSPERERWRTGGRNPLT